MTDLETQIMKVLASARALSAGEIYLAIIEVNGESSAVIPTLNVLRDAGKVTRNSIGYWSRVDVGCVA